MKRSIERTQVTSQPHLLWNAFVDLLAVEEYSSLSPLQRQAQLVFWYDSEVQNGGHGQYLENRGTERLDDTVRALEAFGLRCQAELLSRVGAVLSERGHRADWSSVVDEGFAEALDGAFHECVPSVAEALDRHLAVHRAEYVELV
jgi:Domain of unknown function (DUF4375)